MAEIAKLSKLVDHYLEVWHGRTPDPEDLHDFNEIGKLLPVTGERPSQEARNANHAARLISAAKSRKGLKIKCPDCKAKFADDADLTEHLHGVYLRTTPEKTIHNWDVIRRHFPNDPVFQQPRPSSAPIPPHGAKKRCPYCTHTLGPKGLLDHLHTIYLRTSEATLHDWDTIRQQFPNDPVFQQPRPILPTLAPGPGPAPAPSGANKRCPYCTHTSGPKGLLDHLHTIYLRTSEATLHDWDAIRQQFPNDPVFQQPRPILPTLAPGPAPAPASAPSGANEPCPYCSQTVGVKGLLDHLHTIYLRTRREAAVHDWDLIRGHFPNDPVFQQPRPTSAPVASGANQPCPYCLQTVGTQGLYVHLQGFWLGRHADPLNQHNFDRIRNEHPTWFTGDRPDFGANQPCPYCLQPTGARGLYPHLQSLWEGGTSDPLNQHDFDRIKNEHPSWFTGDRPTPASIGAGEPCPYCLHTVGPRGLYRHLSEFWERLTTDPFNQHDFHLIKQHYPNWFTGDRPASKSGICMDCGHHHITLEKHYRNLYSSNDLLSVLQHDWTRIAEEYPQHPLFRTPPAILNKPPTSDTTKPSAGKNAKKRKHKHNFYCKHHNCTEHQTDATKHLAHMDVCRHPGPLEYPCKWQGCPFSTNLPSASSSHQRDCVFQDNGSYDKKRILKMVERSKQKPITTDGSAASADGPPADDSLRLRCPVLDCERNFGSVGDLHRHLKEDHQSEERRTQHYRCYIDGCGESFDDPRRLVIHVQRHQRRTLGDAKKKVVGIPPIHADTAKRFHKFRCTFNDCDHSYTTEDQLRIHQQSHLPEQPPDGYRCACGEYADSLAQHMQHLSRHARQMAGERVAKPRANAKRYVCLGCMTSFGARAGWMAHTCASSILRCGRRGCTARLSTPRIAAYHRRVCPHALPEVDGDRERQKKKLWACPHLNCTLAFDSIGARNAHEQECPHPERSDVPAVATAIANDPPPLDKEMRERLIGLLGRIDASVQSVSEAELQLQAALDSYDGARNKYHESAPTDPKLRPRTPEATPHLRRQQHEINTIMGGLPMAIGGILGEIDDVIQDLHLPKHVESEIDKLDITFELTGQVGRQIRGPSIQNVIARQELEISRRCRPMLLQLGDVISLMLSGEPDYDPEDDSDSSSETSEGSSNQSGMRDGDDDESEDDESDSDADPSYKPATGVVDEIDEVDMDREGSDEESVESSDGDMSDVELREDVISHKALAQQAEALAYYQRQKKDAELQLMDELDPAVQETLLALFGKHQPITKAPETVVEADPSERARLFQGAVRANNNILTIDNREYRLVNVQGDGNCMHRAFAVGQFGTENHLPRLRADLRQHVQDVFGASPDLDLSNELAEQYIELDQQIMVDGGESLIHQMTINNRWGSIELAQVFANLYGVEVVIHQPHMVAGQREPDWDSIARGYYGQRQIHMVNFMFDNHWMALVPIDGLSPLDTSSLPATARTPFAEDSSGARVPPMIPRQRFIRRTLQDRTLLGHLERAIERGEIVFGNNADHDIGQGCALLTQSENISAADRLQRPLLPRGQEREDALARAIEVNNPFLANEVLTGQQLLHRRQFHYMQFGKARVLDTRHYFGPERMREMEDLEERMDATQLATNVDIDIDKLYATVGAEAVGAVIDPEATVVIDWANVNQAGELQPSTGPDQGFVKLLVHTPGPSGMETDRVVVPCDVLLPSIAGQRFVAAFNQPDPTWMMIGRFSDLRDPNTVQAHLVSQQLILQDCRAAIHAAEALDPTLQPTIGHNLARVRSFWINDRAADDTFPVEDDFPYYIPEHLQIQQEICHNDALNPRPRLYICIRSVSGFTVAPNFVAIRNRWPLLDIYIYFGIRDTFAGSIFQGDLQLFVPGLGQPNINMFTPRSPRGMFYNRQAVNLDDLVAAELHQGNGRAHGGSALGDTLWHFLRLEYTARTGWIVWNPDARDVFTRAQDRNGWQ
ncbi:hypothetical protein LTR17_015586 [Elasticomyces elasticus]|nr:hypothetical protein LTR17_015586 [Elasticomyces elasticus]